MGVWRYRGVGVWRCGDETTMNEYYHWGTPIIRTPMGQKTLFQRMQKPFFGERKGVRNVFIFGSTVYTITEQRVHHVSLQSLKVLYVSVSLTVWSF